MKGQKLFKSKYAYRLIDTLISTKDASALYTAKKFDIDPSEVLYDQDLDIKPINLKLPGILKNYEYENAVTIYEAFKKLTPVQASDARLWTYLSHVDFWDYMKKRRPVNKIDKNKRVDFILQHWFIHPLSASNLMRHDIALLWWGAHMTYDEKRKNPYELTKELFTMLDYTRTLVTSTQGRNIEFVHALLEFVIEQKKLFAKFKEGKVRMLMRNINQIGGYKVISGQTKEEIKKLFLQQENHLKSVKGR